MKASRFTMALASVALITSACSESLPTEAGADLTPSFAANPKGAASGNKIQCFGGDGGTCTPITDGVSINTVGGGYAGVYVPSNLGGRLLGDVNKLSFDYNGTGASGGSPRFSLPIDENGDGVTEQYAFIDTLGCNTGDANVGTADAINDPTCLIWNGANSYANWAAFVAANPTYRISNNTPFIIADQPGEFDITNIQLGRGPAKGK